MALVVVVVVPITTMISIVGIRVTRKSDGATLMPCSSTDTLSTERERGSHAAFDQFPQDTDTMHIAPMSGL